MKTETSQSTGPSQLLNPYLDLFNSVREQSLELQLSIRKKLIWAYSWAIPNDEAVFALRELSPLIEVGAGTGYWAWLLRQAGADVIAVDKNPQAPPHWTSIVDGDSSRSREYPNRTLFLCWPSYQDPMAFDALRSYAGSHVAYVGEMRGRTADEDFHRYLTEAFMLEREIEIPVWPGYRDCLYVFRRKS